MTREPLPGGWVRCRRAITTVVDEVFAVVDVVRRSALARHRAAERERRPLVLADAAAVGEQVRSSLRRPARLVTGLGLVVAPDTLADRPLHVEWWQLEPGRDEPRPLPFDLDPASTGFYDYAAAEWFDAPRRTGARHVEGPYVDVHGTGAYIFTFAVPVLARGRFLGVAAADVPAAWLEDRLLRELPGDVDALVVNAAGRIVLSSAPHLLVGELAPEHGLPGAEVDELPGLSWRALLLPSG